ncbi:unnamed protein product [Durusdinium trenchii]|uniref:Feruloyl esterase D (Ferulic acid esterase D) (FAE) n=2 Tax=Durusdinium trenchii TaxID=1381693 RepID=A0ABP0JRT2_9DINO
MFNHPRCRWPRNPMWLLPFAALASALQVHDVYQAPECSRHPPGKHVIKLPDVQRQFLLVVPEEYAPVQASGIPLVLAFHGFSDSPWYLDLHMEFSKQINRYGWLGILPFGLNESGTNGLDGVGACCPEDCQGECCANTPQLRQKDSTACGWKDNQRDMKFVEAILKWTSQNSCIDPSKVFAAGFSNGAVFVNYLACHANHFIRGFAPISGDIPQLDCHISNPISYISMCGTQDDEAFCQHTIQMSAELLSALNHCSGAGPDGTAVTYKKSATTSCKAWDACPKDNFVEVCQTEGLAHDVSGHLRPDNTSYLRPGSDLDITEYIFQKFSQLVNGSMLFWGEPIAEQLRYKESKWPPPTHEDHPYLRTAP